MEFLKNPNFDFLGKTRYFVSASLLLIVAGIAFMARPDGLRYGVEFSGGTQLVVKFDKPPAIDKIRSAVERGITEDGHDPASARVHRSGSARPACRGLSAGVDVRQPAGQYR